MHMIPAYIYVPIIHIHSYIYTFMESYVVGVEEVGHLEVTVDHPSLVQVLQATQQL